MGVALLGAALATVGFVAAQSGAGSAMQQRQFRVHGWRGGGLTQFADDDDLGSLRRARSAHEFYFSRMSYTSYGMRGFPSWSVDFPKADRQFLIGLERLVTHLDAYDYENPVRLDDPDLFRYPFLYAVEVGYMTLRPAEIEGLRRYLLKGGFLVIDDFWGSLEWENFESQMSQVLPGYPIEDLSLDHPIFHCFYDVDELIQVPNVGLGRAGGATYEQDGYWPAVRGIEDEEGRLMVVVNWNTDLGDAWEWAEDPYYPLRFSTYAYQMGVNMIVYGMSH